MFIPMFAALLLVEPPAGAPAKPSASQLANAAEIRKRFGLEEYGSIQGVERLRVAVLDYGFEGIDGVRPYLPKSAELVEHYDPAFVAKFNLGDPNYKRGFEPGNTHGRTMAQIVWAMAGRPADGPKFFLLNANGPTMLRRAVRYAIEQKVDVVLFSGSFEGGGNFDGRGPINRIVDEAVGAGIIWVNAAGNFGRHVYNGRVEIGADGWLKLGPDGKGLRFQNLLDENTVTVTLNWNSYQDVEDAGTTKNLDLFVEDADGKTLASSTFVQIPADGKSEAGTSRNPRERVVLPDLAADAKRDYRIRVKATGGQFDKRDRIRVLVTAAKEATFVDAVTKKETQPLQFLDATGSGEVFPPADNPRVITVGDAGVGSSVGPTSDRRFKPDFILDDSQAVFTNGESSTGSSNAAAMLAGAVVVLKAAEPSLRTSDVLRFVAPPRTTTARKVEAPPGKELTLAQARQRKPAVFDRVRRATDVGAMKAWRTSDNRLVLGIEKSPAELADLFPRFPQDRLRHLADDFDFFLASDARRTNAPIEDFFVRRRGKAGPAEAFPWQQGGRAEDFVEVRRIPASAQTTLRMSALLARHAWKTPPRSELAAAIQKRSAVATAVDVGSATTVAQPVSMKREPPPPPKAAAGAYKTLKP